MIGQMVHLGVIQGYALLPWTLLAMLALANALRSSSEDSWRRRLRAAGPSVLGLSALWGLADLTGEPRAIAEMQLLVLIVGPVVLLVRSTWQPINWRDRVAYVGGVALACFGAPRSAGSVAAGLVFIKQSQRTGLTYQWFGPVRSTRSGRACSSCLTSLEATVSFTSRVSSCATTCPK